MSAIVRFCVHPLVRSGRSVTVGGRGSLGAIASGSAARSAVVRGAWRCGAHGGPTELGAALAAQLSKPGGRTTAGDLAADFRDSVTAPGRFLSPLTPVPTSQLHEDEVVDDRSVDWRYEVLAAAAEPSMPVRVRVLTGSLSPAHGATAGVATSDSESLTQAGRLTDRAAFEGTVPQFEEAVEEAARGVGALALALRDVPSSNSVAARHGADAAGTTSSATGGRTAGAGTGAFSAAAIDFIELD